MLAIEVVWEDEGPEFRHTSSAALTSHLGQDNETSMVGECGGVQE